MITETLKWRQEFNVDQVVEVPEVFSGLGYVHGKDKAGRPVTCVLIQYHPSNVLRRASLQV